MSLPRDALAGLIFIAFGLGSIWIASGYELGTARAMGPGYFPVVLGGLIAILGGSLTVRALLASQGEEGAGARWNLRPLILIPGAVLFFAILIRPAGLVVSTVAIVLLARLSGRDFRLIESVVIGIVLSVICAILFVYGLGMPLQIRPAL